VTYPDADEPGVALGEFMDNRPGTGVSVWCLGCGHKQRFDMAAVIARLDARGLKGRSVGIRTLPRYLTKPCPACSGSAFEARPDFPSVSMGLR
jgi:hypothetical protein